MRLTASIALAVALLFAATPALAQSVNCDKVPDMMTAEPAAYADCQPTGATDALIDPALTDALFGGTPGIPGFGINLRAGSPTTRGFITFDATDPTSTVPVLATTDNFYAGDFAGDDFTQVYAVLTPAAAGAIPELYTIDPASGARTLIGSTGLPAGASSLDMAWDYTTSTMYFTSGSGTPTVTSLYTLNLTTGAATLVAPVAGGGFSLGINLLAHPFTGVLYSVDLTLDDLFMIDKATGAATVIGDIGYNLNFAQGADFDNATGTAYLCAYQGGGVNSLRTVDLNTGLSSSVGSFNNAEVDICAIRTALGTPPTGPILAVSRSTVAFGGVPVNTMSSPETVTLTNNGTDPVVISSITGSGAPFTVNTTGTMLTLAPGESTTFTVTYSPTVAGNATGTVTVTSNAPGSPFTIDLTGSSFFSSMLPPGNTTGAPTWARPTNVGTGTSGSCTIASTTTGNATPYATQTINVTTAGTYTITTDYSQTAAYDGFIFLYQGMFNPTDQCLNLIALDDDFNGLSGSQIENVTLAVGDYTLVVTGYNNLDFGMYTGTVTGPATVGFAVAGQGTPDASQTALTVAPNPAHGSARVRVAVETAQDVTVAVYDVTGRQVATLFQGAAASGQTLDLGLETSSLPAGVYMVRAQGETMRLTQRVTVVR